jgi:ABC-type glycerol-3-phosphate transport system substrate-binding protein
MRIKRGWPSSVVTALFLVSVAACGSDDDDAGGASSAPSTAAPATTTAATEATTADTEAAQTTPATEATADTEETTAETEETVAETAETTESSTVETAPVECGEVGDAGEIDVFLIPSPSSTAIQSFIPAFEEATCVKVNFSETPYGEAHQKQLLAYEQGDGQYDVAQFDNTFLAAFGAAEAMTPLDDYLAASEEYDIDDFAQGQQDYGKYEDQTLGLTLSTEPMIQWYRTDIYEELGLEPATTWEEFRSNAQAIKESGRDGVLMGFGPSASWWWMTLLWSFGGNLYDEDLNPTVNTPEAIEATEYLASLLEYAPDGAISANGDDVMFKFLTQDIGAIIQYSGYYGFIKDESITEFGDSIGTARMPMGDVDITHLAGWNIGIPADSEDKDLAWSFLEFVLGKSNAEAYLESGAAAIGRKSITENEDLVAENPYLELLTIPDSSRIERYPQLKVWPEMDVAISATITGILSGQEEVEEALNRLNEDLAPILAAENG